jgi:twinkle protein
MLNAARLHGWKWCVFSPENMPLAYHWQKLAEKLIGKPMFNDYAVPRMTPRDRDEATEILSEIIRFVTIDENSLDLDGILAKARVCAVRDGVSGFVLDPYNEISHTRPGDITESEYISRFLSKCRNFGRLYNVAMFIVAHPTKLQQKDDGSYPVPTPYDISGSANWRNKADACIAAWRSYEPGNSTVHIHIQKVRDKNLGETGSAELFWQRSTGRFFEHKNEMLDGREPDEGDEF